MKSCYIKGFIIGLFMFYPCFELSRIIISYYSGGYWHIEPFTFATILENKPWSGWCYIVELGLIWVGYFMIIFLTIWWDKKLIVRREKQLV